MPYYNPDIIAEVRKMDLLTYLQNYEPQELIHLGGDNYCTREHDSLKISNGKWYWFSRGIGGTSALDYLIKVKEIPFTDAVEKILGQAEKQPPVFVFAPKHEPRKVLLLPKANRYPTRAVNYLTGRGIDRELIYFCIRTGRMYESQQYNNVVFVGHDRDGNPRYANMRGVDADFVGEANGSDKRYSFEIPADKESDTLHLFESAIDLLSYGSLLKLSGREWRQDNLLSLAGVYRARDRPEDSKLPLALTQYLLENPHICHIVLRLDNDRVGWMAAKTIQVLLKNKYGIFADIKPPPYGKDYNDYLCMCRGLAITKRKERILER